MRHPHSAWVSRCSLRRVRDFHLYLHRRRAGCGDTARPAARQDTARPHGLLRHHAPGENRQQVTHFPLSRKFCLQVNRGCWESAQEGQPRGVSLGYSHFTREWCIFAYVCQLGGLSELWNMEAADVVCVCGAPTSGAGSWCITEDKGSWREKNLMRFHLLPLEGAVVCDNDNDEDDQWPMHALDVGRFVVEA